MEKYTQEQIQELLDSQPSDIKPESTLKHELSKLITAQTLLELKHEGFFLGGDEEELRNLGYRPLNIDTEYIDWDKTVVYVSEDPIKSGKGPHVIVKEGMISGIRSSHPYSIKQGTITEQVEAEAPVTEAPTEPTYMNMKVPTLEITFYFNPDNIENTIDATLWNPMPGR